MMDDGKGHMSEVEALLAERSRYEGWLQSLEQRRESTPGHIYERVHADYAGRLQRVFEELGTHRPAVEEMIAGLDAQLATLDDEERRQQDERAEAELRAMIGEYSEERCATVMRRCDEEISRLTDEKSVVHGEVARLRAILDGSPAAAMMIPTAPPSATPVEEQIVIDEDPMSEPDADADAAAPAASGEWTRPPAPVGDAFDELEFLKNVVEPGRGQASGRESGDTPAPPTQPAEAEIDAAEGMRAFLRTTPTEQVKTLRCQECNTMNYPTEWYCERCGAELAAM